MGKEKRYLVDGVWTKVMPEKWEDIEGIEIREYLTQEEVKEKKRRLEI